MSMDKLVSANGTTIRDVDTATTYLKTLGHRGRLNILCHLMAGERSVGELEDLLDIRQAAVSQLLARLREEGLVDWRREGKTVYYRLDHEPTRRVLRLLADVFSDNAP